MTGSRSLAAWIWQLLPVHQYRERLTLVRILQTGIAAGSAFGAAELVGGREGAIFASLIAMSVLGVSLANRQRRTIEATIGITIGLGVGTLVIDQIGTGAWQMVLIVIVVMLVALRPGSGTVLVQQLAINAAIVSTTPASHGLVLDRMLNGLIGGAIAITISMMAFPLNPTYIARRATEDVLDQLAEACATLADGLWDRSQVGAARARDQYDLAARRITAFRETIDISEEVSRVAPMWRRRGTALMRYVAALEPLARAVTDAQSIFIRAIDTINAGERTAPGVCGALAALSTAADELHSGLAGSADQLSHAQATLVGVVKWISDADTAHVTANILIAQIHSVVLRLLEASGLERDEANESVQRALASQPSAA